MKVALLQMNIEWGNPAANIKKAEEMMKDCEADLYVLPEMWNTGFAVHPEKIAEDEDKSLALAWMKTIACQRQCALCGSLAVRDTGGNYRNRLYFITPEGAAYYDKRHLFTFAGEDQYYVRGEKNVVVSYREWSILLLVCYDLRFPVWSRWGKAGVYDAIIYVANWPDARQEAWYTLLRARAIENQCYVVAVNRVGVERKLRFSGGSALIDPTGNVLVSCSTDECVAVGEMEPNSIKVQRTAFPVLQDRD